MYSERISRAEAQFFLQRNLYPKGWKKVGMQTHSSGYVILLERDVDGRTEHMKVRFSSSGWVSYE